MIPFNKASLNGGEIENVLAAIANGHISGDGEFTKRCHRYLEDAVQTRKALLTTSCTHALEIIALLLNIAPGDEVIVPSFTFVSTVNAFVLRGARPVFVDVRPDTLNLDESLLEAKITPRCKAIVVVHYAGVACEMDAICAIAARHGIPVVEDNAHGLFGAYRGKPLGSIGCMASQSFHETKNFTCGEGGALLINDEQYIARAEIIREKGTNRSQFFRGAVDKYSWVDVGSSYLPSDILAGFLLAQLEAREKVQTARKQLWDFYWVRLQSWARSQDVRLPVVPEHCEQPYHMFYLLFPSLKKRSHFISHMKERGIMSVFHYLPLHISEMGKQFGGAVGDCPVTEDVSDRLARLPFFAALDDDQREHIISTIIELPG